MRKQRGFTLVEIVVAFVLLSLVLATSYQLFSTGMARAGDLDDYSRALEIAQTQIAQASIGDQFEQGETGGESEDERFRWVVSIAPGDDNPDPSKQVYAAFNPIRIGVRVAWKSASGADKQLELATLVVGKM